MRLAAASRARPQGSVGGDERRRRQGGQRTTRRGRRRWSAGSSRRGRRSRTPPGRARRPGSPGPTTVMPASTPSTQSRAATRVRRPLPRTVESGDDADELGDVLDRGRTGRGEPGPTQAPQVGAGDGRRRGARARADGVGDGAQPPTRCGPASTRRESAPRARRCGRAAAAGAGRSATPDRAGVAVDHAVRVSGQGRGRGAAPGAGSVRGGPRTARGARLPATAGVGTTGVGAARPAARPHAGCGVSGAPSSAARCATSRHLPSVPASDLRRRAHRAHGTCHARLAVTKP